MDEHHEGLWWAMGAGITWGVAWFLRNIEAINSVMHFVALAIAIAAGLVGLRKTLRK